jgi:hypothetical protein
VENISYDTEKAKLIISGQLKSYVPDVDVVYDTEKGICFDYASLMAAMLRSQGIPTKLVMGYVAPNNTYHAWNEVYIAGVGWVRIRGQIYFDGVKWTRMDATFAAGNENKDMTSFFKDDKNYAKTSEY